MAIYVDIEKKFGDFCLKSQFEAKNEILAILGASGCGKSVTLKCIAGLVKPDRGKIILDGKVLFDSEQKINLPARDRSIGYLFQNYALFPNMTVEANIECGLRGSKEEKRKKTADMIERFYLTGCEKKYPYHLSGGQQQRTALARMLATEPKLIMLDEPFSALDSYLKWQLEQELLTTLESFPGTTLFVSHNRDEVYRLSDQIAVMSDGKIDAIETKKELFRSPKTLSATLLTGCKNISKAKKIDDHTIQAIDWNVSLQTDDEVWDDIKYVGFRAHFFELVPDMEEFNVIEAKIDREIEDTFSMIVMFYNKSSENCHDLAKLRYELPKEEWKKISRIKEMYLKMPEDQLIQMR